MSGEILVLLTILSSTVTFFACFIKARLASLHDDEMILRVK